MSRFRDMIESLSLAFARLSVLESKSDIYKPVSDHIALKQDWGSTGKDIKICIDKYKRINGES